LFFSCPLLSTKSPFVNNCRCIAPTQFFCEFSDMACVQAYPCFLFFRAMGMFFAVWQ
jgi:hypothetical protein